MTDADLKELVATLATSVQALVQQRPAGADAAMAENSRQLSAMHRRMDAIEKLIAEDRGRSEGADLKNRLGLCEGEIRAAEKLRAEWSQQLTNTATNVMELRTALDRDIAELKNTLHDLEERQRQLEKWKAGVAALVATIGAGAGAGLSWFLTQLHFKTN